MPRARVSGLRDDAPLGHAIGWRGRLCILGTLAVGLLAAPLAAGAQAPAKVARVGYLAPGSASDPARQRFLHAFQQGLRDLGYVEGQNIIIEARYAEGNYERLPDLAAELVRLKVDVIVAVAVQAIQAARQASATIPIVMAVVIGPVAAGFVVNLARPGGNATGLSAMFPQLVGKQLEIPKEVVPKVSRVALVWNPANAGSAPQLREAETAARALGVRLQALKARNPREIETAFAAMTRERAGAAIVLVDAILFEHRTRIADLAAKSRLPAVYGIREHAEAGGLMAYGANVANMYRRAATYVDKILKGAKPTDLPVEQPTRFELVINMKTAKALGLTIPPSVLIRADQVIE